MFVFVVHHCAELSIIFYLNEEDKTTANFQNQATEVNQKPLCMKKSGFLYLHNYCLQIWPSKRLTTLVYVDISISRTIASWRWKRSNYIKMNVVKTMTRNGKLLKVVLTRVSPLLNIFPHARPEVLPSDCFMCRTFWFENSRLQEHSENDEHCNIQLTARDHKLCISVRRVMTLEVNESLTLTVLILFQHGAYGYIRYVGNPGEWLIWLVMHRWNGLLATGIQLIGVLSLSCLN